MVWYGMVWLVLRSSIIDDDDDNHVGLGFHCLLLGTCCMPCPPSRVPVPFLFCSPLSLSLSLSLTHFVIFALFI